MKIGMNFTPVEKTPPYFAVEMGALSAELQA
jgi:hypothetical protein